MGMYAFSWYYPAIMADYYRKANLMLFLRSQPCICAIDIVFCISGLVVSVSVSCMSWWCLKHVWLRLMVSGECLVVSDGVPVGCIFGGVWRLFRSFAGFDFLLFNFCGFCRVSSFSLDLWSQRIENSPTLSKRNFSPKSVRVFQSWGPRILSFFVNFLGFGKSP